VVSALGGEYLLTPVSLGWHVAMETGLRWMQLDCWIIRGG